MALEARDKRVASDEDRKRAEKAALSRCTPKRAGKGRREAPYGVNRHHEMPG